jgi:Asp-tRNA(Asn)/Glu-tRNA(Gln) amidotransferase A subunit family amidase
MARVAGFFRSADEACPDLSSVDRVLQIMRSLEFLNDFKEIYDRDKSALAENVIYEVERALQLGIPDAAWALGEHARIHRASQAFFERYDLLFTPAASVPPFRHEEEWPRQINGEPMANYLRWEAIAYGVTLMGNPAAVIPCGRGPDGLPFGLQIVGPLHRDAWLADVAVTLEALLAQDPGLCRPKIDLPALRQAAANRNIKTQQERKTP